MDSSFVRQSNATDTSRHSPVCHDALQAGLGAPSGVREFEAPAPLIAPGLTAGESLEHVATAARRCA